MATTRRARAARPTTSHTAPSDPRLAETFAVCGLALVAARHFVPAESAHLGETLWIAAAWLLLATAWMLLRARGMVPRFRFDRCDLAVALIVGGHAVAAALVLIAGGHRRAALNMLWEWIAVGLAVVLSRHWLTQSGRWPALWRLLAIAGVILAALGLWQFAVTYPSLRGELIELDELQARSAAGPLSAGEADRLRELRVELGQLATEADPHVRAALRQRLLASTEPLACFALANTLAGVLAVALILLLGALAPSAGQRTGLAHSLRIGVPALLVAGCLLLTKSRTAWIGLLAGLAMWGGISARGRLLNPKSIRIAVIGALVVAVLVTAAVLTGALDQLVLLEAPKSLRYRVEYWTGAWGVIREHIVFGVGPGNFRQHYLRHKVAGSSEEVLEPHNMFLDVWANGGLIALSGLVLAAGVAVQRWRRLAVGFEPELRGDSSSVPRDTRTVLFAGAAGISLVLLKSGAVESHWDARLGALLAGWIAAGLVVAPLNVSPLANMAAGTSLGVHLLGAGGIAMPVVITTLLLLWLGPPTTVEDADQAGEAAPARADRRAIAGLLLLAVMTCGCLLSGVVPVMLSAVYVDAATSAMAERGDAATARRFLEQAIEADALDPQPRILLAQLEHDQLALRTSTGPGDWDSAMRHLAAAIRLDPQNPKTHWLDARWKLERNRRFPSAERAEEALQAAQRAAQRDPQHAGIVATLAETYAAADRPEEARAAARRALALDALNLDLGHYDRLLGDARRAELERIAAE